MSLCISPHHKNMKKTLSGHRHMQVQVPIFIVKETSLSAFRFPDCYKGSFTVEAALVIPFVAGCLVTVLFFFRMLQVQAAVDEALYYAGQKVAAESSITDSDAALYISAEIFFLQIAEEYACIEQYVDYGSLGISLLKSDFSEEDICLRAEYRMKLPVTFFGRGKVYIWQQNSFRKWTGDSRITDTDAVYVSKSGEVYHKTDRCRALCVTTKQTYYEYIENLRGADGQKYYPCSNCVDEVSKREKVYYTDYGTLFHKDVSCSALKRTVMKIPITDIGERRKCSYCY